MGSYALEAPQCAAAGVLAVLLGLTVGCTQMTQAEIKALETREMNLPYDEGYKAAANGLFSLGFTISHSDKDSGILTGMRHDSQTGLKIANTIMFGVIGLAATGSRDEAVTLMLTAVSETCTQLRMKVLINGKPVVDRQFMTKIWQQIEREAMLESRPSDRPPASEPTKDGTRVPPHT